jgi:hypothetical protein
VSLGTIGKLGARYRQSYLALTLDGRGTLTQAQLDRPFPVSTLDQQQAQLSLTRASRWFLPEGKYWSSGNTNDAHQSSVGTVEWA